MELVTNYKDNNLLRQSFNQLSMKTFGIDFEDWYQKGLWGDNYICYSWRDGDRIIANVSVTRMSLQEGLREKKLIQIGTVMTDVEYRSKGLAGKLMEHVLKKYEAEYEGFYLFANENVLDFYPKFGFERTERLELFTRDEVAYQPFYQFRRLNLDKSDDLHILKEIAEQRIPTSNRFFFQGNEEILYWYCLGLFKNVIHYCEEQQLILIYAKAGDRLNIYDVISSQPVSYRDILKSIQADGIKEIIFHFNLDTDELKIESRVFDDLEEDDPMFVRGKLDMNGVTYPITSHT